MYLASALASMMYSLRRARRFFRRCLDRMSLKGAARGEFAQLVADHVFRDVHGDEFAAVVNGDRVTDEFRQHGGTARPGADDFLLVRRVHLVDLLFEVAVCKRPFLYATPHKLSFLYFQ